MAIYLRGLMMGLAYVAPIGTQNLFVINTAVTQPKKKAFLTALIITFFDISLSLACFFGVGALMEALPWLRKGVLAIGSLIVIFMGIGLIRSKSGLAPLTNPCDVISLYIKEYIRCCKRKREHGIGTGKQGKREGPPGN